MEPLTLEQLEYSIQFLHPERLLARFPGPTTEMYAALFGIDVATYERIKAGFAARAREAAIELLHDAAFAARVDRLPFPAGSTIVGLGDSITDDLQSWLEILRALLEIRRPQDEIVVLNAGISGDTTTQMITRFLEVVQAQPAWIICMAGTNDARHHGLRPTKALVSVDETERNLRMLRHYAATQTATEWAWMTPAPVIEEKISAFWSLGPFQMQWPNASLAAVADAVRRQPDTVIDLYPLFGSPPNPALLLDDGLHPSLAGQKVIVRALVEALVT